MSPWLAAGQAAGFPCTTASSRESQLAQLAEAAFQAKDPSLAGLLLAVAMLGYLAGQVFGPGAATAPTAFSAGVSAFQSVFADHQMPVSARAKTIAGGCQVMAMSTIVAFGVPPFAAPIV
ncbi:MAG: hypothetical protein H6730_12690 [Deltaproteobacteria bacterium]|nr:hypothetical protein [Deltaproteobacteria bacterium]